MSAQPAMRSSCSFDHPLLNRGGREPDKSVTAPGAALTGVLGGVDDPGIEVEIAVRKFDVPHEFSDEAERLAKRLPDEVRVKDLKDRIDLRDVAFVTIDGEDARDFDDAVYAEVIPGKGWRLLVAIADVSHYVISGDALHQSTFRVASCRCCPRSYPTACAP